MYHENVLFSTVGNNVSKINLLEWRSPLVLVKMLKHAEDYGIKYGTTTIFLYLEDQGV